MTRTADDDIRTAISSLASARARSRDRDRQAAIESVEETLRTILAAVKEKPAAPDDATG